MAITSRTTLQDYCLRRLGHPVVEINVDDEQISDRMDDALEFILNASDTGKGSEIFIPKLKSYEMPILIEALSELCGKTEQEISGIRPGEKLHETLINHDEIRYSWEINNMYMLANPHYNLFKSREIVENYDGIKKVENMNSYSSDISEKITKDELKEKIKNSGLLD